MSSANRTIRYGAPVITVIIGVLFAAVETNSLGNTVSLVLIGGGLIWFMTTLGRDMGMTASTGRTPRVPDLPPAEDAPARPRGGSEDADGAGEASRRPDPPRSSGSRGG